MKEGLRVFTVLALMLCIAPFNLHAATKRPPVSVIVFNLGEDCGVKLQDIEGRLRRVLREANIDAVRGGTNYSLFVEVQASPLKEAPGCAGRIGLRFTEGSLRKSQFLPGGKRVQILLWENSALLQSNARFNESAITTVERQAKTFAAWFHDPK